MAQYFSFHDQQIGSGDTVRVHQEIFEGDKKRIQVYEGVVIAIKNRGAGQSFTVRKVSAGGYGVEKIFPTQLPSIKKVEVKRKANVRRAKLYYLRGRLGKAATKTKEKKTVNPTVTVA